MGKVKYTGQQLFLTDARPGIPRWLQLCGALAAVTGVVEAEKTERSGKLLKHVDILDFN